MRSCRLLLCTLALTARASSAANSSAASAPPPPGGCVVYLRLHGDDAQAGASAASAVASVARAHAVATSAAARCAAVTVRVGSGTWAGPWVFPRAPRAAITYAGSRRAGAPTVISGGLVVAGWSAGAGGAWRASVPPGTSSTQLFVRGVRRPRARAPNIAGGGDGSDPGAAYASASTFAWASPLCPACAPADPRNALGLVYAAGDAIDAAAWDFSAAEALVFSAPWATCAQRVGAVVAANRTLLFARAQPRCDYALGAFASAQTGRRWLLENVRGALDAPGEWFLNASTGVLEYLPLPGEALAGFAAVLAVRGSLLAVAQDGLRFDGIAVEYFAADAAGRLGAGFATSGAVEVNASDVALTNVTVAHGGANCVVLRPGVARVLVARSALADCGGNGLYMATQGAAEDVLVTDTTVDGVGLVYLTQPTGILLNGGRNVSAVHNSVTNSSYSGIAVAWMHGAAIPPSSAAPPAYRFNVSFNRVAGFGRGIMSDMAGVRVAINNGDACFLANDCYVPTLVANNVITGGRQFAYGANGIYTDNAVAGVDMRANIVADVDGLGVQLHCGTNNSASNNLVYDARGEEEGNCSAYGGVVAGCTQWPLNATAHVWPPFAAALRRNILVATRCALFGESGIWPNPAPRAAGPSDANMTADDNVYFALHGAPATFPLGLTLDAWRAASGNDARSVLADPQLADPAAGDFTVLPGSPAWALGWAAIDTASVGPRGAGRR